MEQPYLFEVLVDKIAFGPTCVEVPDKKDIQVVVTFAHLFNLVVETEDLRGFSGDRESFGVTRPVVKIYSGRSQLFHCPANELYKIIIQSPLQLFVKVRFGRDIGRIVIPWSMEIIKMIDTSRISPNNLMPVSCMGIYDIVSDDMQQIVGDINVLVRMSCLRQVVPTQA